MFPRHSRAEHRPPTGIPPCDRRWSRGWGVYRLTTDVFGRSRSSFSDLSRPSGPQVYRLFAGAVLLAALGCSSLRKVSECKRVVDTVNGGLSRVALTAQDAGANPTTYAQLAEGYEALAKSLESASSDDDALNKAVGSYRELVQRAAKHSKEFSEELDRPTSTPAEEQEKEARLGRLRAQARNEVSREAALVRKLNGLCHTQ
jgi:hypothetical protein